MRMKRLLVVAAFLAPPATAMADGFNGFYLGGGLSHTWADDKGKEYDAGVPSGWTQKTSPNGFGLGVLGGYNWMIGNAVLGVEADYDFRSGSDSSYQKLNGATITDFPFKTKLEAAASIRARAGFLATKQVLLYATAGYGTAKVHRSVSDADLGERESHTSWQDGWTAGLGAEYLFSNKLAARIEYRHADYGRDNMKASIFGPTTIEKQDLKEDSLRIGLSYQF